MRKILVGLFAVLIIGIGIVGINHEPEPNKIMEENNEHRTTITS